MASRVAAVIFALVSLPLLALTVSLKSCDEFPVFNATGTRSGLGEAQRQAQEWADDQQSRLGCQLVQVRAQDGIAKAQYRDPDPLRNVVSFAAVLSVAGAVIFGADGWVGRSQASTDQAPKSRSA